MLYNTYKLKEVGVVVGGGRLKLPKKGTVGVASETVSENSRMSFLPRDAMHSAYCAVAGCPSVCHTPVFYRNGYKHISDFFHRRVAAQF